MVHKNLQKVYKVCDKFLMWDSFNSVTIDMNMIVQVGESAKVNTLGDLILLNGVPQFDTRREGHGTVCFPKVVLC